MSPRSSAAARGLAAAVSEPDRAAGEIKYRGHFVFLTEVLTGEPNGLEEVADGAWVVYFAALPLGVLDDATHQLHLFPPARIR